MISAHIASIYGRQDSLLKVIRSIYPQVDAMFVALNSYPEVPKWMSQFPKCHVGLLDNRLGDAAKMLCIPSLTEQSFVFTCDDDLIYAPNYCKYIISKYNQHKGCIITLHGKVFKRPIVSSHRGIIENYRCLGTVVGDHVVDTGGTGTMLINTNDIKIDISEFKRPNMADIWLAKIAHEQGVKIVAVGHPNNLVKYLPQSKTIWRSHTHDDDVYQTNVLNEFLK